MTKKDGDRLRAMAVELDEMAEQYGSNGMEPRIGHTSIQLSLVSRAVTLALAGRLTEVNGLRLGATTWGRGRRTAA